MNKAAIANLLVRANAFAPFRFLNRGKLLILMYHRFSEGEEFGKTSRRTFELQLQYLTRNYRIISLSDAVTCLENGDDLPVRSAVITIDDGYSDFYDIAFPVLKNFDVPAVIYVVAGFVNGESWIWTDKARYILSHAATGPLHTVINGKSFTVGPDDADSRLATAGLMNLELKKLADDEKNGILDALADELNVTVPEVPPRNFAAMSWDQARELAASGIEVGSHTTTHPILTNVDEGRLRSELEVSKTSIENELQRDAVHFCYPNGNVSLRERNAAAAADYASAVTTEISLCENSSDRFMLPRIDAEPEMHRFVQATSGFDSLKG